jgi:aspartyl protease family protein
MIEIVRDGQGQFHLSVDVGGQPVRFLVDTGADVVALTEEDADRLGLRPDPAEYRPMLQTASGTGMAAPVEIDRLTIGGRDLTGVAAVVVPSLPVSLLGQSALRRLGSVTLKGDRLIIAG